MPTARPIATSSTAAACAALLGAALFLTAQPVGAQTSAVQPVGSGDLQYLQQSGQDEAFQLACAELAVQNSLSPDVRQLGTTLVQDYAEESLSLGTFAHDHAISVPVTMSGEEAKEVKSLQGLRDSAFDLAYARLVTTTYAAEATAGTIELNETINKQVRDAAALMHDALLHHLNLANGVAEKLGVPTQKETPQRAGLEIG